MTRCCEGTINISSIEQFKDSMLKSVEKIQHLLEELKRFEKRIERIPELIEKLEEHKEEIRCELSEYFTYFENPYYQKMIIHFPGSEEIFINFRSYVISQIQKIL